jgi:hypothetical protein
MLDASNRWIAVVTIGLVIGLSLGYGCSSPQSPKEPGQGADEPPTVRLVLLSNVAGALEPCGCTKDQLGGLDHLAALLAQHRPTAPSQLVVGAGAMLFDTPQLEPERANQDQWQAETLAQSLSDMGLRAWAPGAADFAAGFEGLEQLRGLSKAELLALNFDHPLLTGSVMVEVGGIKIGLLGMSDLSTPSGEMPEQRPSPRDTDAGILARRAAGQLVKDGAQLLIALAAMPRAGALRLVDAVPALNVLAIGDPAGQGLANDSQPSPMLIGPTLVVQSANHGQTVAIVDIHLGDPGPAGLIELSDAGGIERAEQLASLTRRVADLETRIVDWETTGRVEPKDLAARRADLASLRRQRATVEQTPLPQAGGNWFRYGAHEVHEAAGSHPLITQRLVTLNQRVNDHNRKAFADRRPRPAGEGAVSYVGVDACSSCHAPARKHWDARPHARAYRTLQRISREYDLECVGCHVTGYEKPGGSTVTFNDGLRDVQCEACHGPGSRHAAEGGELTTILRRPEPQFCVDACHHSPHVEGFDPVAKMPLILGPGHGG